MRVQVFSTLRGALGGRSSVELEHVGTWSVKELLAELEKQFPGFREKLHEGVSILVNGRNIAFLQGLETDVPPDAVVSFIPPSAGG
ncbi:MAG TPA: MoaD/ThiS family protein [Firmicutes bacterium]|nr:MoaD/ThiS family protein [Bacillota bacterium]